MAFSLIWATHLKLSSRDAGREEVVLATIRLEHISYTQLLIKKTSLNAWDVSREPSCQRCYRR